METKNHKKPLIICITDAEYSPLKSRLSFQYAQTIESLVVEHGFLGGRPVAVCRFPEMGSRGKDTIAQKLPLLLKRLSPSLVIEVGICFGLKDDFPIGSVGICQHVVDYELQKIEDGGIAHRAKSVQSCSDIYSKALNHSTSKAFDFAVKGSVYACGDKVVNSASFKKVILHAVPDAKCGDMESYSVGIACENEKTPWIVIKASSDDGVNKGDEYQNCAANNSVFFLESFISESFDLDKYFEVPYDVDFIKQIDFEYISREIFNSTSIEIESISTARDIYSIHKHPEMGDAWVTIYVSKAHSIPETLRATLKKLPPNPARVDVCIASSENIGDTQKNIYSEILRNAGCRKYFVAEIGEFIFKRIIEKHAAISLISPPDNYVDQMIYTKDKKSFVGSRFARTFIYDDQPHQSKIKSISIILGQGGIGKTTFCLLLAKIVNGAHSSTAKRMLLITKADILKNYSGEPIDSISRLYMEYARNITGQVRPISHETFSLALSCGSLILMIDGIDEIESALGEKFNMPLFLESISNLNESLNSCRVLMTSRDSNSIRFAEVENTEILFIKGFSNIDIEEYTSKETAETRRKIKDFSSKIKNQDGLVNPYLLHVVRQFLLSDKKENWEDQAVETRRLKITEPFDYCLARALLREIEKQSLGISIDDYYDLLTEVVIEKENRMEAQYLEEYIETFLHKKSSSVSPPYSAPYLKFFLFEEKEGIISISHPEYVSHILLNKLYEIFTKEGISNDTDVRIVRSILGGGKSEIFGLPARLCVRIHETDNSESAFERKIKYIFDGIKKSGRNLVSERAIHELHILAMEYWRPKTSIERRITLEKLHQKDFIEGLCVITDLPPIDFTDCVIKNSTFRNFISFFNCKTNENTKFSECSFNNCSTNFKRENVRSEIFDDCHLDDGMKHLLYAGDDKRTEILLRSKSDVKHIFKSLRQGLGFLPLSLNKIKAQSSLVSDRSYEEFLGIMCAKNVLIYSDSFYSVAKDVEKDAIALCDEDHSQGAISLLIKALSEK